MDSLSGIFPAQSVLKCNEQIWRSLQCLCTSEMAFTAIFIPLKNKMYNSCCFQHIKGNGESIDLQGFNIWPECYTQCMPLFPCIYWANWHTARESKNTQFNKITKYFSLFFVITIIFFCTWFLINVWSNSCFSAGYIGLQAGDDKCFYEQVISNHSQQFCSVLFRFIYNWMNHLTDLFKTKTQNGSAVTTF